MISQFADHTKLAIKKTKGNIQKTFKALQKCGGNSGLKLNMEKTEISTLGKMKKEDIPPRYRHQLKNKLKILGTTLGSNMKMHVRLYWEN